MCKKTAEHTKIVDHCLGQKAFLSNQYKKSRLGVKPE
jgi:hypothetical protein